MLTWETIDEYRKLKKTEPHTYKVKVFKVSCVRDSSVPIEQNQKPIASVEDIAAVVREYLHGADREHLVCVMVNARNKVIGITTVSVGTLTASLAHPREIFKAAIVNGAAGIILAHNHPSGDPSPSDEDNRLTRRIKDASLILGIQLLDHVIVAEGGVYSYAQAGVLL